MRRPPRSGSAAGCNSSLTRGRWAVPQESTAVTMQAGRESTVLVTVLGLVLAVLIGMFGLDAMRSAGASALAQDARAPVNSPDSLVGAEEADPCSGEGTIGIIGTGLCTHGADPLPSGAQDVVTGAGVAPAIDCAGDGTSGYRVQVLYVRPSNVPSQASTIRGQLREIAQAANQIYRDSAAQTGGYRSIRFVHDSSCRIVVDEVVISSTADDYFNTTITALEQQGYGDANRMYMIFMDTSASGICGIGTYYEDDRDSAANYNNTGAAYGRTDRECWAYPEVLAHELMHNLGAVQPSAPNSTDYGHCTDEYEIMCYVDGPTTPPMRKICTQQYPNDYSLFDCRNNDYFHTNPSAGSYLATHWNAADNQFLIARDPTLTLDKEKSKFNGPVVATLTEFAPNTSVTLRWPREFEITSGPDDGDFTTLLASGMTDDSGQATLTFRTPLEPLGDYKVTARDSEGGKDDATLRVIPRILLNEDDGPTTTTLRVYFYGFGPGDRIDVRWHANGSVSSSFRVLKTITVASNGRASSLVTIPSNTGVGTRMVVGKVVGVSRSASTPFEVTAGGVSVDDATATPTRTASPTRTATPASEITPTVTPTATPEPEATATATVAPEPPSTQTPGPTPEPTETPTSVPPASPVADAGADVLAEDADGSGSEMIGLNGSGSSDPDGGALTYSWSVRGTDVATGVEPILSLPVGGTVVTLTVTDESGLTAVDDVLVTVSPGPDPEEAGS